jgi:hypothetical protein
MGAEQIRAIEKFNAERRSAFPQVESTISRMLRTFSTASVKNGYGSPFDRHVSSTSES